MMVVVSRKPRRQASASRLFEAVRGGFLTPGRHMRSNLSTGKEPVEPIRVLGHDGGNREVYWTRCAREDNRLLLLGRNRQDHRKGQDDSRSRERQGRDSALADNPWDRRSCAESCRSPTPGAWLMTRDESAA